MKNHVACNMYATVLGVCGKQQGEGKMNNWRHFGIFIAQNLYAKKEPLV